MTKNTSSTVHALTDIKGGATLKITKIEGGLALAKKLENIGIREGDTIKKINAHIMRGPVVLKVKNSQVALGHAMAKKIWGTVE